MMRRSRRSGPRRRLVRARPTSEANVLRESEQVIHALGGWTKESTESGVPAGVPKRAMTDDPAYVDPVVMIATGERTYGTGAFVFLLDTRQNTRTPCVVTCLHCISRTSETRVIFDHDKRTNKPNIVTVLDPDTFFLTLNATPDVCVCALRPFPGMRARKTMSVTMERRFRSIRVIQHPRASHTVVSDGYMGLADAHTIVHNANTLPGASGGPIVYVNPDKRIVMCGVHCEAVDIELNPRTTVPLNVGFTLAATLTWLERNGYIFE